MFRLMLDLLIPVLTPPLLHSTAERILYVTVKTVDIMTKNSPAQSQTFCCQGETTSHPLPASGYWIDTANNLTIFLKGFNS